MLDESFNKQTQSEMMNLNGVIEEYFDRYCQDHKLTKKEIREAARTCNNIICPNISPGIAAASYTSSCALSLRNLFRRIRQDTAMSDADFRINIRPLITEPLEHYLEEQYHEEDPLWGAWYKADDYPGGADACESDLYDHLNDDIYSFTEKEQKALAEVLLNETALGELAGYSLMLYTGASAEDITKVKFSDIYRMFGPYKEYAIHYMGSFPKFDKVTDHDVKPRFSPVPDKLHKVLRRRMAVIEVKMSAVFSGDPDFTGAEDLPIACHGKDYKDACTIRQATNEAGRLLRSIGIEEARISLINRFLLKDPALCRAEGSGALAIARRTYETGLFRYGAEPEAMQYLMGYCFKNESFQKDIDFSTPEMIHEVKEVIEGMLDL